MLPHELGHLLPLGEHGPDDELAEGVVEGVAGPARQQLQVEKRENLVKLAPTLARLWEFSCLSHEG